MATDIKGTKTFECLDIFAECKTCGKSWAGNQAAQNAHQHTETTRHPTECKSVSLKKFEQIEEKDGS